MDDKKNIVLAVVLTALILFGWPYVSQHFFPAANPPVTRLEGGKATPIASGPVASGGPAADAEAPAVFRRSAAP